MMHDDSTADTLPGGTRCITIPCNKLRIEIETITLFFTVESKICLFAGQTLISESRPYNTPPTNKQINLFVRSQIIKERARLIQLGIDVVKEIKNFGG